MVVVSVRVIEHRKIDEADRNRRPQDAVRIGFLHLLLVKNRGIVDDALVVIPLGEHLHLDIELPTRFVASFDIEDRELVLGRFFRVEGIQDFEMFDLQARCWLENRVDQIDQVGILASHRRGT